MLEAKGGTCNRGSEVLFGTAVISSAMKSSRGDRDRNPNRGFAEWGNGGAKRK